MDCVGQLQSLNPQHHIFGGIHEHVENLYVLCVGTYILFLYRISHKQLVVMFSKLFLLAFLAAIASSQARKLAGFGEEKPMIHHLHAYVAAAAMRVEQEVGMVMDPEELVVEMEDLEVVLAAEMEDLVVLLAPETEYLVVVGWATADMEEAFVENSWISYDPDFKTSLPFHFCFVFICSAVVSIN